MADFALANHGTICTLRALTDAAHEWVEEFLPEDFSGVIESRYVPDIVEGIRDDGLEVELQ